MDEQKARQILGEWLDDDDQLDALAPYVSVSNDGGDIVINGEFSVGQLEAIVWWMRKKILPRVFGEATKEVHHG